MDELDDSAFTDDECEDWTGEECGRWDQNAKGGMLSYYNCRLAGTEFCQFDCPYGRR